MFTQEDCFYMQKALDLARQAAGRTSPNPLVGAVLVKNGAVVGEGYHAKAGEAHAEVRALAAAGPQAREATLYINLEPCCHHGRTPPCADALIAAGLGKAVVAMVDPNPLVAGKGLERLQSAGVAIAVGLMEEEARRLNEAFIKHIQTGRPFVTLKTAMTLDGKIASVSGDSRWISNEESRAFVHTMRDGSDAILAGIGTVIKDDPLLNTRLAGGGGRNPLRVILDGALDIPLDSRIVQSADEIRTLVFCADSALPEREEALKSRGLEIIRLPGNEPELDLPVVMDRLGHWGVNSLLVEGGSRINAALLQGGLVDKVVWFVAPKILGGAGAPSPVGGAGIIRVNDAIKLSGMEVRRFGQDLCITAYIRQPRDAAER